MIRHDCDDKKVDEFVKVEYDVGRKGTGYIYVPDEFVTTQPIDDIAPDDEGHDLIRTGVTQCWLTRAWSDQ